MHEQIFFPAFLQQAQYCSFSPRTASRVYPQMLCLHACFPLILFLVFPSPTIVSGLGFLLHLCLFALLQLQGAETGIRFNLTWLGSSVMLSPAKIPTWISIMLLLAHPQPHRPNVSYPVKGNHGENLRELLKEISIILQYS